MDGMRAVAAASLVVLSAGLIAGCATGRDGEGGRKGAERGSAPAVAAQPAAGAARLGPLRLHRDAASHLVLPLPASGARLIARHFDPSLPAHKMRHQLTVELADQAALRLEVWDNPAGLSLSDWVERHLGFVLDAANATRSELLTASRVEGLIVDEPRSPQALARRTAVAIAGGRVFRLTCLDADDPTWVALFERVTAGLVPDAASPSPGGAP